MRARWLANDGSPYAMTGRWLQRHPLYLPVQEGIATVSHSMLNTGFVSYACPCTLLEATLGEVFHRISKLVKNSDVVHRRRHKTMNERTETYQFIFQKPYVRILCVLCIDAVRVLHISPTTSSMEVARLWNVQNIPRYYRTVLFAASSICI